MLYGRYISTYPIYCAIGPQRTVCKDGFIGEKCEVGVYTSSFCNNNGLCSIKTHNGIEQLQCECFDGFEGLKILG